MIAPGKGKAVESSQRDSAELNSPSNDTTTSLTLTCDEAFASLCQYVPASPYRELESAAIDEAGRFKLWAANIEALQIPSPLGPWGSSSKTADRTRLATISALNRLKDALGRASDIAAGTSPNSTNMSWDSVDELSKQSAKIVYGSSAYGKGFDIPTTELAELFINIRSCITHLFTLSTLTRQDRPRERIRRQVPLDLSSDADSDIFVVENKFPKLVKSPWLAERLGVNISQQRRYVRNRQMHRKQISNSKDGTIQDVSSKTFHLSPVVLDEAPRRTNQRLPKPGSVYTATTSSAAPSFGIYDSGRRIPDLSDMWLDGFQLGYDKLVECPYCRMVQYIKDRSEWKYHVYCDLQAYICIFQNCSADPFSTPNAWFQHELDHHRRQWNCSWCHTKFESASALDDHFNSQHPGIVSTAQRRVMLKACEKAITYFDKGSCPLCNDWNPSSAGENNVNKFRSHLAKHLQDLTLEALPAAIDGLHIKDAKTSDDVKAEAASDASPSRSNEEPDEAKNQEPIKFKDAVGRKFSFPYHVCNTWAGMEELIKQAFLHVDVIGPHVQQGRYDLMKPNGETVSPRDWEKFIKSGERNIEMRMWPFDELPAKQPPLAMAQRPAHLSPPLMPSRLSPKKPALPQGQRPALKPESSEILCQSCGNINFKPHKVGLKRRFTCNKCGSAFDD